VPPRLVIPDSNDKPVRRIVIQEDQISDLNPHSLVSLLQAFHDAIENSRNEIQQIDMNHQQELTVATTRFENRQRMLANYRARFQQALRQLELHLASIRDALNDTTPAIAIRRERINWNLEPNNVLEDCDRVIQDHIATIRNLVANYEKPPVIIPPQQLSWWERLRYMIEDMIRSLRNS
jgi:hypothetical protein